MDEAEDLGSHAVVEPGGEVRVVLIPEGVAGAPGTREMLLDGVLLEHNLEESAPVREIGWVELEDDRDVLVDVHAGEGRWVGRCSGGGGAGVGDEQSTTVVEEGGGEEPEGGVGGPA